MKRIRSLQLHTHKIKVTYKRRVLHDDGSLLLGNAQPNTARIFVATHCPDTGTPIPEELIRHNLYHEVAHYMFYLAGRHDLYEDEQLVDLIGGMLAQTCDR